MNRRVENNLFGINSGTGIMEGVNIFIRSIIIISGDEMKLP